MKLRVYVASPYSIGDQAENVRAQIDAFYQLTDAGLAPFAPLIPGHFVQLVHPSALSYEEWMELDRTWVETCDALLRLPGESSGADREVQWAHELGKPVFHNLAEVLAWKEDQELLVEQLTRAHDTIRKWRVGGTK